MSTESNGFDNYAFDDSMPNILERFGEEAAASGSNYYFTGVRIESDEENERVKYSPSSQRRLVSRANSLIHYPYESARATRWISMVSLQEKRSGTAYNDNELRADDSGANQIFATTTGNLQLGFEATVGGSETNVTSTGWFEPNVVHDEIQRKCAETTSSTSTRQHQTVVHLNGDIGTCDRSEINGFSPTNTSSSAHRVESGESDEKFEEIPDSVKISPDCFRRSRLRGFHKLVNIGKKKKSSRLANGRQGESARSKGHAAGGFQSFETIVH